MTKGRDMSNTRSFDSALATASTGSRSREIRHAHLFCGLGGGARGFNRGVARVGCLTAQFRCLGGIDDDPAAVRDFSARVGTPATLLDLFSRDQYLDYHG